MHALPAINAMNTFLRRIAPILAFALCALALPGCGSYVLHGKVVRGSVSSIQLVMPGDERLNAPAISGADVRVIRDPNTPNRQQVGQNRTDPAGEVAIVMSAFGTGWMEEQWLVQAFAPGYQNAATMMNLPSRNSKWRVLITLAPGVSEPITEENLMEDLERFK